MGVIDVVAVGVQGPPGPAIASVATPVAVSALAPAAPYPAGATAFAQSTNQTFQILPSSTLTVDGNIVLTATTAAGGGRWVDIRYAAGGGGSISTATTTTLVALATAALENGQIAFVQANGGSYWTWYPTGTTPPLGSVTLAATGGLWATFQTGSYMLSASPTGTTPSIATVIENAAGSSVVTAVSLSPTDVVTIGDSAVGAGVALQARVGASIWSQIGLINYETLTPVSKTLLSPTFQFDSTVAGGLFTQASTSIATKGADLGFTPQQSTQATNQGGGNAVFSFQAPLGLGVEAGLQIKRGTTLYAQLGALVGIGSYAALYLGTGIVPGTANPVLYSPDGVNNTVNAATSVNLAIGTTNVLSVTSTSITADQSVAFAAGLTASGSVANDFSGGSGAFKTSTGAVTLGTGQVTITGSSAVTLNPNSIQWVSGAVPLLTQASESTATKGADFGITPQQSTHATDQGGGNAAFTFQAPTGAGVEAGIKGYRGATNTFYLGQLPGLPGYTALYLGGTGITLDTSHPFLYSPDGVNNTMNAATSVNLAIGTTNYVSVTAALTTLSSTNVNFASIATTTSSPSAGAGGALPATPAGYATFEIAGVAHKIAYY